MSNFAKLWAQKRINQASIQRANEAIHSTGRALPCRVIAVIGSLVTVGFEVNAGSVALPSITIPKAESNWIRNPTQIGDTGITIPSDVYLGIISGQSPVLPSIYVKPGNLSSLVFMPVSNKNSPPSDPNAAIVQGPNGFIGQVVGGASSVIANETSITLTFGTSTIVMNASGITITSAGQTFELSSAGILINGLNFGTHYHYVPGTPGNSDGPL